MSDSEEEEDDEYYLDEDEVEEQRQTKIDELKKESPEDIFERFDKDDSGFIDYDEFVQMLPELRINMTEAKALKYFRVCDSDGSGEIDIDEFKVALFACDPVSGNPCGFAPNKLLTPQDAFEMFDEDGSGKLDEDEFFVLLEYLGLSVSDADQERYFKKYDQDSSGYIDYDEFKEIWLKVANVKTELANRGIKIPKYTTHAMLVDKLDRILEQEERAESKALAEAQRFRVWQLELTRKRDAIERCQTRAEIELGGALDSAGQVYVFGGGERAQFQQIAVGENHKSLQPKGLEYVTELWRKRVAPTAEEVEAQRNPKMNIRSWNTKEKQKSQIGQEFEEDMEELEAEMEAAAAEEEEKATKASIAEKEDSIAWKKQQETEKETRLVTKFANVNCAANTSVLWGKRVVVTSCAMNNLFALTDLGEIYAWGGQDHWWHEIEAESQWQSKWRGDTTERSQKLLMTSHVSMPPAELAKEEVDPNEEEIEKLKTVSKYYDVWEPAPSAHTRLLHMKNEIIPRISLADLQQSLEIRRNEWQDKTQTDMIDNLYKLIVAELKHLGKRTHREICAMDKDIRDLKEKNKHAVVKTLTRRIAQIWNPLNIKVAKEEELERRRLANAKLRHEQEVDYNHAQWRKHIHSARFDHEPVFTERGNSRLIQVSGITARGAGLNTPRGMQSCVQVVAGGYHAAMIHADGNLYTWGLGASGRLGHDDTEQGNPRADCERPTIVRALRGKAVLQCSLGYSHSAAVVDGNELYTWGSAASGKLGLGEITSEQECFAAVPTWVPIPKHILQVSCGNAHTGAVTVDGELYMWGNADGGRLGLGARLEMQPSPVLVESLLEEKVLMVACGNNHTLCVTATIDALAPSGGNSADGYTSGRVRVSQGGDVYQAGASVALGKYTPTFELVDELCDLAVRQVACGYGHSCAVSSEGELYAWGGNRDGCLGHPLDQKFVGRPKVVECLFVRPANLALNRNPRQSSTYNSLGPERAVDGNTRGDREKFCCHTQLDPQAWWEVDLGNVANILTIKIWNRDDEPYDPSMERNTYTKRIAPCWIMCSHVPFGDLVGGESLGERPH
jgi:alpha-tubulin suppressor-like RCC1 family protein/Ca2+-binding EF-hand superfamily protein